MNGVKRPATQAPVSERGRSQSEPAQPSKIDAATTNEVRTKLDLARQFIDMGDPDSARLMLNEVLEEGDASQKQEAQRLVDALPRS